MIEIVSLNNTHTLTNVKNSEIRNAKFLYLLAVPEKLNSVH